MRILHVLLQAAVIWLLPLSAAIAAPLVPTPGSPAGYQYFPKSSGAGGIDIQLPAGRNLCTIISTGETVLDLSGQPPDLDLEVSYFIAGGGAGAGAGSLHVSPSSPIKPGGDGEIKRGKFTIPAGDTSSYRLVVGAGGNAGGLSGFTGSVIYSTVKTFGRGGGGGAGWRGGGSGQAGKNTGSGAWDMVMAAGGGGGSSAIVRGTTVIVAANGGDAADNEDHAIYGGRGGTESARGLGRCAYSVGLEAAAPSCGTQPGHASGNTKGRGGHNTTYWQTHYSGPRYACRAPDYMPFESSGCDSATYDWNSSTYSGTPHSGGLGYEQMRKTYFDHAGRGGAVTGNWEVRGGNAGMIVLQYWKDYCFLYTP